MENQLLLGVQTGIYISSDSEDMISYAVDRMLNKLWPGWMVNLIFWSIVGIYFASPAIHLYLLLAEFSVRTVNYGPSFFPSIYGPRASRLGHKSMEKTRTRNLQYGPKKRG